VIGVVLAAGAGSRLAPLTDAVPKTLLPVADGRCILDVVLANLALSEIREVAIVTGVCGEAIATRTRMLEQCHDVRISLIENARARDWNNAYSLWHARTAFDAGVLLVNGDTLHPAVVEERLLAAADADPDAALLLAIDDRRPVRDEAMKVVVAGDDGVTRISKGIAVDDADGEYIGVALVRPSGAEALTRALEDTWRRDPSLYYEDAFQLLVDRGHPVRAASIGAVDWVEVDDHVDLAVAREIACRS
jgi:choline kinase